MLNKIGFDNEKYLKEQTSAILKKVKQFNNKLYLEFGGKLIFDYHAARVLPGFDPNVKIRLLQKLKDKADIILCIYAGDIERKKVRADFGITYDVDALKLIDGLKEWGLNLLAVVITRFTNQPSAIVFKNKLERQNIRVYTHPPIKGYPNDVELIASNNGYGKNHYIKTSKPLVIVTGPGPGSGKLSTCLSQLYHDYRRKNISGYAKFETFPIWNLPLEHAVNVAYEAATADINDYNMIDPFHFSTYKKISINYNRDVELFPVLSSLLENITGKPSIYKSPTDMGVNRAGFGIINDNAVTEAAKQEVIRRYFRYTCEYVLGFVEEVTILRIKELMKKLCIKPEDRKVVMPARRSALQAKRKNKGNEGIFCGAAIELKTGAIITGNNSTLLHAGSSLILNALKHLANMRHDIHILSPVVIKSIGNLKKNILNSEKPSMDLEETLIALSISATTSSAAKVALEKIKELQGCEIHMTHIPTPGDEAGLRKLGVNLTSDPNFSSKNLFIT